MDKRKPLKKKRSLTEASKTDYADVKKVGTSRPNFIQAPGK